MASKYHLLNQWNKIDIPQNLDIENGGDTLFSYYEEREETKELSKTDKAIRIATVFSGIGAPEEALRQLNIKCEIVFACDIEPKAKISYEKLHGQVKDFYTDIKEMTKRDANGQSISMTYKDKVDLFVGGSPCPSFSTLGRKLGFADDRGQLFFDYIQMVKDIKPTIFIFENVRGFVQEEVFLISKKEFIDLQSDYDYMIQSDDLTYWNGYENILNAKYYGLPQSRSRFYLVGVLKDKKKENFPKTQPPKQKLEKTIWEYLDFTAPLKISASFYIPLRGTKYSRVYFEEHLKTKGQYIQCQIENQQSNSVGNFFFLKTNDLSLADKVKICKKKGEYYFYNPVEDQDSVEPLKDCDEIFYAIFYSLSTDECFRLMGFEQTIIDKKSLSLNDLYGQAGNSMAVDVLKALYKHIDLPQYANG
jgi:DNA (cytosine-5)-methyltransferase 1